MNTLFQNKEIYLKEVIPSRLESIEVFNLCLQYKNSWVTPQPMKLYVNDSLMIEGLSTAFTNPVIEVGAIHCRALLEFLGLKINKKQKLVERKSKYHDEDVVIEDFEDINGNALKPITLAQAVTDYQGPKEYAIEGFRRVIHIANKGIAHSTLGLLCNEKEFFQLDLATRGIRVLMNNYFYIPMGMEMPLSRMSQRPRTVMF